MAESELSFVSSKSYRDALIVRNLPPYNVPGVFSPSVGQTNYETNLTVSSVVDSPNDYISFSPFSPELYPLNKYGPREGYNRNYITYNQPAQVKDSNLGEYRPTETKLDVLNDTNIDAAYIENVYGPEGGFNALYFVSDVQKNNQIHQPYWSPPSFEPSTYSPYDLLTDTNPSGSNGPLSSDSYIAKIGAQRLKYLFEERIGEELYQQTVGAVNLQAFQDPFDAIQLLTGREPLIARNFKITAPENIIERGALFLTQLSGTYFPVSPIPGSYFNENTSNGLQTNQTSNALSTINRLTGGLLGPILNITRNPSQIFLANTGNGQKSVLFRNLNYNRYQPYYDRSPGGLLGIATAPLGLLGIGGSKGNYYVGSKNAEPSQISSPPNQIPVNSYGQQVPLSVYGPTEMGILYEGNENKINFGLKAKPTIDGGGIVGDFVWTTKKTKGGAGYKPTIGGGLGTLDSEFNIIGSNYTKNESSEFKFKKGSILDQTQKIIESADNVNGISRLKHVGNAINQVSKVFNDGYREITKGSKVIKYKDNADGSEIGTEYGRVFAKDTPYYTYNDLQKSDGITKQGRRFSYSVIDSTFNLNIAPLKGENSTNIVRDKRGNKYAKKYMFSIENLAWRTSSRPGFTYEDLPAAEKGPNGGRVMWFPPYELSFNDTSTADWNNTSFIGRTEPIWTYKHTTRNGTISWKIIVDSPSVLNLIVDKQLKGIGDEKVDSILKSFFAGCAKYDLYTLAKKFNTFKTSELLEIQAAISNPQLTKEEAEDALSRIPKANVIVKNPTTQTDKEDPSITEFKKKAINLSYYFYDNNTPSSVDSEYSKIQNNSLNTSTNATSFFGFTDEGLVLTFIDTVIKSNYEYLVSSKEFINDLKKILDSGNEVDIEISGNNYPTSLPLYQGTINDSRFSSIVDYYKTTDLKNYIEEKKTLRFAKSGSIDSSARPKTSSNAVGNNYNCEQPPTLVGPQTQNASETTDYSVTGLACRSSKISNIKISKSPPKSNDIKDSSNPVSSGNQGVDDQNPTLRYKIKPNVDITSRVRQGIGKKILRSLLTEGDYFEVLEKESPFIYDSLKSQIKYFSPAFHSMTPEGLNARLTFLNQCVRPGDTIPVIGPDGKPKFNDAVNTSFGTPPVLVLRIGDFYHTKVIPKSLQISYDPLIYDINPEGIGLQPMIAKISLGVEFIGGHGLAKPVEQLQNALSFNFYANTEVYDERAVATEDTSKLDQEIFDAIAAGEKSASVNDVNIQQTNRGGKTIGDISTTVPVTGGETGFTTYQKVMDSTLTSSKDYFNNLLNNAQTISEQYNYGIWQLTNSERNYTKGNFEIIDANNSQPEQLEVKIFGKPFNYIEKIQDLFKKLIEDIEDVGNDKNFIIKKMASYTTYTPANIELLKVNFSQFLKAFEINYTVSLANSIQTFTVSQQEMVQNFRKINLVNNKTDGKILDTGKPFVYSIEPTEATSTLNTFGELRIDYGKLGVNYNSYNTYMEGNGIIQKLYDTTTAGAFSPLTNSFDDIQEKRMYMVLCKIFDDQSKLDNFIKTLLDGGLDQVSKFEKRLKDACDDFKTKVKKELEEQTKLFKKIKAEQVFINYQKVDSYTPGKARKFSYTTVPGPNVENQKNSVKFLWSNQNINADKETWEGKIKFE